uniref:Uncharacterized protein n=1 Tax=Siphoviridae sp. ctL7J9 TaxID=2827845 RepID=A0A8S5T6Q1_9CAUD|nr:MAG TPA: hypothetical protein [Siphoviridae sp. ctL7J9]
MLLSRLDGVAPVWYIVLGAMSSKAILNQRFVVFKHYFVVFRFL